MRHHLAYSRDGIQDWVNYFCFIQNQEDKSLFEKVETLLQIVFLTRKKESNIETRFLKESTNPMVSGSLVQTEAFI